jgi:hypothetical protein
MDMLTPSQQLYKLKQNTLFTYKHDNEVCSQNHCSDGKAESITLQYSECVYVAIGIQHAKWMH